MINAKIVITHATQNKPFQLLAGKGLDFYAHFQLIAFVNLLGVPFWFWKLQHNEDYVVAAVFGGYFYIINRIFSIR